jgi:hypothetical protein
MSQTMQFPTSAGQVDIEPENPFAGLPLLLEINAADTAPVDELPSGISRPEAVLAQPCRVLPMGTEARRMVYRLGAGLGLKAGKTFLLEVEYPDDVPRAFFMANRGADLMRGWATGTAIGDARRQYVEPSVESLAYPQTGKWQRYRQIFVMHERLQGAVGHRNPDPGGRPYTPADGFHVVFFQTTKANDPRSQGLAIRRIRLYAVPDPKDLYAPLNRPPAELPQRRVFWREEMADQAISGKDAADRAFAEPLEWYAAKLQLAKILGMDTFAKDLLEFGFNQGWESGDQNWTMDAQPPLRDLWTRLVPLAAREGFTLLPYYEYKGSLGLQDAQPRSLGWQRRAEKLYHGIHPTGDDPKTNRYTGTWWAEGHNADLTDPDTKADFERVLDRTVVRFKGQAQFAGAWLRTRHTHLPISFSAATIKRFQRATQDDPQAANATRAALIKSYEGDQVLYTRYLAWWLDQRKQFLANIQEHLFREIGGDPQVLFTPWTTEQLPELIRGDSVLHAVGVVTDDAPWWETYVKSLKDDWYRWKWVPTAYHEVVSKGWWTRALTLRRPINDTGNWGHAEIYHSAPGADPERYAGARSVMMTYPIGRQFAVAGPEPISSYRSASGLTVVHHFTLNENDEGWEKMDSQGRLSQPFQGTVGYAAVDVDRAGPLALLGEAKAVAYGDPRNIAFLCGSSFSTGFPVEFRQFALAFQAVPALPSVVVKEAASDADIVVREIQTDRHGTYYFVVNPTWTEKQDVRISLPARGKAINLVTRAGATGNALLMDLAPASLHAFMVR